MKSAPKALNPKIRMLIRIPYQWTNWKMDQFKTGVALMSSAVLFL